MRQDVYPVIDAGERALPSSDDVELSPPDHTQAHPSGIIASHDVTPVWQQPPGHVAASTRVSQMSQLQPEFIEPSGALASPSAMS